MNTIFKKISLFAFALIVSFGLAGIINAATVTTTNPVANASIWDTAFLPTVEVADVVGPVTASYELRSHHSDGYIGYTFEMNNTDNPNIFVSNTALDTSSFNHFLRNKAGVAEAGGRTYTKFFPITHYSIEFDIIDNGVSTKQNVGNITLSQDITRGLRLDTIHPHDGSTIELEPGEKFVLEVAALGDFTKINVSSNFGGLPDFSVGIDGQADCGGAACAIFDNVSYSDSDKSWYLRFTEADSDKLVANGAIDFYITVQDANGDVSGPTPATQENTINYTFKRMENHFVNSHPESNTTIGGTNFKPTLTLGNLVGAPVVEYNICGKMVGAENCISIFKSNEQPKMTESAPGSNVFESERTHDTTSFVDFPNRLEFSGNEVDVDTYSFYFSVDGKTIGSAYNITLERDAVVDTEGPAITAITPYAGAFTSSDTLEISAEVNDPSGVKTDFVDFRLESMAPNPGAGGGMVYENIQSGFMVATNVDANGNGTYTATIDTTNLPTLVNYAGGGTTPVEYFRLNIRAIDNSTPGNTATALSGRLLAPEIDPIPVITTPTTSKSSGKRVSVVPAERPVVTDLLGTACLAGSGDLFNTATGEACPGHITKEEIFADGFNFTAWMKHGSVGSQVPELQKFLNANGYNSGAVDGIFGPITKAAVMRFQAAQGLATDGVVGPRTRAALNA